MEGLKDPDHRDRRIGAVELCLGMATGPDP
jgi:hypothetical protein